MSDMIERAAQAICETAPYERTTGVVVSWDDLQDSQKESFRERARAVVAATMDSGSKYEDDIVGYGPWIRPGGLPASKFTGPVPHGRAKARTALLIGIIAVAGLWGWLSDAWQ
jgi:hypothetical protein